MPAEAFRGEEPFRGEETFCGKVALLIGFNSTAIYLKIEKMKKKKKIWIGLLENNEEEENMNRDAWKQWRRRKYE